MCLCGFGQEGTESIGVEIDQVMGATNVCVEAEVDWAEGSARGTGDVCSEIEDF